MGSVVKKVGQGLGIMADENAGSGSRNLASSLEARAVAELEKLGVPAIEAQRVVLERPELVGELVPEEIQKSMMEEISTDPKLESKQMSALDKFSELAETGIAPEDLAQYREFQRKAGAQGQAQQEAILSQMQQQGLGSSGARLIAQLGAKEGQVNRAAEAGDRLTQNAADARRQALAQSANLATQVRGQQFGEQSDVAKARDAISQFNAMNRQNVAAKNLGERQRIADQRANLANQQQMYNKGLIQQDYQNKLQKATGMAGAVQSQAKSAMDRASAEAQASQASAAGMRDLVIGGSKAAAGMMADGGVKYQDGGIGEQPSQDILGIASSMPSEANNKPRTEMTQPAEPRSEEEVRLRELKALLEGAIGKDYADGGNPTEKLEGTDLRLDESLESGIMEINPDAQGELLEVMRGHKPVEEMGEEGRIVEGANYAGDELPDRINSGEMVSTVAMQDRTKQNLEDQQAEIDGFRELIKMLGRNKRA